MVKKIKFGEHEIDVCEQAVRRVLNEFIEAYPVRGVEITNLKREGDTFTGMLRLPLLPVPTGLVLPESLRGDDDEKNNNTN